MRKRVNLICLEMTIRLFLGMLLSVLWHSLSAQTQQRTNLIGVGTTEVWDTYLSPEKYSGTAWRYVYDVEKPVLTAQKWNRRLNIDVQYANVYNRTEVGNELTGMLTAAYFWQRHLLGNKQPWQLQAGIGPMLNLGFIYNTQNGNNPAQAKAQLNVAAMVKVGRRFRVFGLPLDVRYVADMPLVGLMFTPNYGQSYYEIFQRNNYDGNVVLTSPFSGASLRHSLSVDVPIFNTWFRLAYLGEYRQAQAHSLKYHAYTHALMVGWVSYFSLQKQRP